MLRGPVVTTATSIIICSKIQDSVTFRYQVTQFSWKLAIKTNVVVLVVLS